MRPLTVPLLLALGLCGCSRPEPVQPRGPVGDLPPAYPRSAITDPATVRAIQVLEAMVARLQDPDKQPLYSAVEIMPPTRTVLPYGVGRYEQQVRLPVILTTGMGWGKLDSTARETQVRKIHADCLAVLQREGCKLPLTLTVQEPRGWQVAWLNDANPGKTIFVGDGDE